MMVLIYVFCILAYGYLGLTESPLLFPWAFYWAGRILDEHSNDGEISIPSLFIGATAAGFSAFYFTGLAKGIMVLAAALAFAAGIHKTIQWYKERNNEL